jgi:hypothetical protein
MGLTRQDIRAATVNAGIADVRHLAERGRISDRQLMDEADG